MNVRLRPFGRSLARAHFPYVALALGLLVLVIWGVVAGCSGEERGRYRLAGTLNAMDAQPVPLASVILVFVETQIQFEARVTNSRFVFASLPPDGTYVLSAVGSDGQSLGFHSGAILEPDGSLDGENLTLVAVATLGDSGTGPVGGLANQGFEEGLTGWRTGGHAEVVQGSR
jgi:hypothetical protein